MGRARTGLFKEACLLPRSASQPNSARVHLGFGQWSAVQKITWKILRKAFQRHYCRLVSSELIADTRSMVCGFPSSVTLSVLNLIKFFVLLAEYHYIFGPPTKKGQRTKRSVFGGEALWRFVFNVCADLRTYFLDECRRTDENFFIEKVVSKLYGMASNHIHDLGERMSSVKDEQLSIVLISRDIFGCDEYFTAAKALGSYMRCQVVPSWSIKLFPCCFSNLSSHLSSV